MKKSSVILIINFLFFCIVFVLLNCISVYKIDKSLFIDVNKYDEINISDYDVETIPDDYIQLPYNAQSTYEYCGEDRTTFGTEEFNNNPIVVLGCSYAYGHGIDKNESFSALLSKYSKRPVYNFSQCGGDAIYSVNYLEEHADKEKIKNADYVVYVWMYDHIIRFLSERYIYTYDNILNVPKYERILAKIPLFKYIFANIRRFSILKDYPSYGNTYYFHKAVMSHALNKMKKYMPHARIIIVIYDVKIPDYLSPQYIKFVSEAQQSSFWSELSPDITVVHTKDVNGFIYDYNYKLKADIIDWHPNAKAWQVFTESFVQKYIK